MRFIDKNQTLDAPKDFKVRHVRAEGAYLRVEYGRRFPDGDDIAVLYLNDMGREVARIVTTVYLPPMPPAPPAPVGRKFRIKNGFLIALQGLQEMFQ
jgi:hypothetical protein